MTEWAIETYQLGRQFRKTWAVRDLNLQIPKGSAFGLLGPNGAGKSTTIQMLLGLLPPSFGSMSVLGLNPVKQDVAVRRRVGYVAEIHGFYEWMTVDETIQLVSPYHERWDDARSQALMKEFGLDGTQHVRALSKGMRAKLALLLALAFNPEMLILDEPTGGLDPAARRGFIESILAQYQESGKTILVSSHLLNEFSGLLDRIAFLKNGKLHVHSSMEELHQKVKRARLVFPDGVPKELSIPGARSIKSNGRETLATFDAFDPEETPRLLHQCGAANFSIEELTLEDIFVEMVGS